MKTCVCITTINAPTDSVRAWAKLYPGDVNLIVVGDAKTPLIWQCAGASYVMPYQMPLSPIHFGSLEDLIGPNKYQRKMLGYVEAARQGAEVIIDTDDDNEPLGVNVPSFKHYGAITRGSGWCNPYALYESTDDTDIVHPWPRGLPLSSASTAPDFAGNSGSCDIGIWQGLADGDPDVDAIWRMICGEPIKFDLEFNLALSAGTLAPINSQATLIRRECFPLLYLPCTVSMRVCDILRGYVAQPVMWAAGYRLGFCGPIVRQQRNPHDLMDDFRQELPLYLGMGEAVIEKVCAVVKPEASMVDNLRAAYRAIVGVHGIGDESATLEEWLEAIT
jgi:hypothetical protein